MDREHNRRDAARRAQASLLLPDRAQRLNRKAAKAYVTRIRGQFGGMVSEFVERCAYEAYVRATLGMMRGRGDLYVFDYISTAKVGALLRHIGAPRFAGRDTSTVDARALPHYKAFGRGRLTIRPGQYDPSDAELIHELIEMPDPIDGFRQYIHPLTEGVAT